LYAKQATTGNRMLNYDFDNVWIMNDDGPGATPLTVPADHAFGPIVGPDGAASFDLLTAWAR